MTKSYIFKHLLTPHIYFQSDRLSDYRGQIPHSTFHNTSLVDSCFWCLYSYNIFMLILINKTDDVNISSIKVTLPHQVILHLTNVIPFMYLAHK